MCLVSLFSISLVLNIHKVSELRNRGIHGIRFLSLYRRVGARQQAQPKAKQPYPEQSPEHQTLSRLQNRELEVILKLNKIMTKNCMF